MAGIQNKYSFSITDRPEEPNPHLFTPTLLVIGVSCKKILSRLSKNVSVKLNPPLQLPELVSDPTITNIWDDKSYL